MDKGAALNERVWSLFERAGFKTKPNSNSPMEEEITLSPGQIRTLDLSATVKELGVKIIGWNKAVKKLKESLTVHINDYEKLKELAGAQSVLFTLSEEEVPAPAKRYAEKHGMRVWGKEELYYFEKVVDALGKYAKYEIINHFGIDTAEQKSVDHILALRYAQPYSKSKTDLFVFTAIPEKLLRMCVIYRRASGSGETYQRMVKAKRLVEVANFINQKQSLLPPSIIVNLGDDVTWSRVDVPKKDASGNPLALTSQKDCELVVLKIPQKYASLEVIDGQHRLFGFVRARPSVLKNFNLSVIGLGRLRFAQRRDLFIKINDESRRIDPNLVAFLKYTDNERECRKNPELMAIKVVVELNKIDPFKKRIRLIDVGEEIITLKGFSGYDLRSLVGPRGILQKYYNNDSEEFISALALYFGIVRKAFKVQWQQPNRFIIFQNRGISAFLKLLRSILKNSKSQIDATTAEKYLAAVKKNWKHGWQTKTLKSKYIGGGGWTAFHRDLVDAIRKDYPKFKR